MDNSENTHRKRTQRDYTLGFKLQVVASVEQSVLGPCGAFATQEPVP